MRPAAPPFPHPGSMSLRMLAAGAVVAGWVVAGVVLRPSPSLYLLLGVPLMAAVQIGWRRHPLHTAWVFADRPLRLDGRAWGLAVACGALPALIVAAPGLFPAEVARPLRDLPWAAATVAGGLIAGITLRHQDPTAFRRALPYVALAVGGGVLLSAAGPLTRGAPWGGLHADARTLGRALVSAILYVDVGFVVEEVAFRGVLDPYVLGSERGRNAQYASAVFSSTLWGFWHFPVALPPGSTDFSPMVHIVAAHASLGLFLCFAARTAGTLLPSALAHGLIDVARDLMP